VEAAQAANLDISVAIAQILQADAQVRIAGAPLLPLINFNGSDTAGKVSQQLVGTGAGSVRSGKSGDLQAFLAPSRAWRSRRLLR
jgi:outer membrane protein, multidrug efflux system